MSKMSKAIAVLGVVAGLGVAALPLSTYAAGSSASKNGQVQVKVEGAISVDIVEPTDTTANQGEGMSLSNGLLNLGTIKVNGDPVEGKMGVRVATNNTSGYYLQIKAATTTDMIGADDSGNATGSVIPANAALSKTSAGWAYKVGAGDLTAITTSPVTIKTQNSAIADGSAENGTLVDGKNAEVTDVTFSVSADSTTAEGTYTGTVVFIATAND